MPATLDCPCDTHCTDSCLCACHDKEWDWADEAAVDHGDTDDGGMPWPLRDDEALQSQGLQMDLEERDRQEDRPYPSDDDDGDFCADEGF